MALTDADRRAYAARQARIREINDGDDRADDALLAENPQAWLDALDAEIANAEVDRLIDASTAPAEPDPVDVLDTDLGWIGK